MTEDLVILVDDADQMVGEMGKMEAHSSGVLHRAFSVFIFNDAGEMLIHQRAANKYHSAELWTNACCSHPRPGETTSAAADRRLTEEMGISCELSWIFQFTYLAKLGNGLIEHELDHVFMGSIDGPIAPDPEEVMDYRWISIDDLLFELNENPDSYTAWFRIALPRVLEYIEAKQELTN